MATNNFYETTPLPQVDGTDVVIDNSGKIGLGSTIKSTINGAIPNPTTKSSGQILTYNGTSWEANTQPDVIGGEEWTAKSYNKSAIVIKDGKLYSPTVAITSTTWVASEWEPASLAETRMRTKTIVGTGGEEWNSSTTYAAGDVCIHNNVIYTSLSSNKNVEPGVSGGWATYWSVTSLKTLCNNLTNNGKQLFFGYNDGKYGYYEDSTRGADTFHPFKSGGELKVETLGPITAKTTWNIATKFPDVDLTNITVNNFAIGTTSVTNPADFSSVGTSLSATRTGSLSVYGYAKVSASNASITYSNNQLTVVPASATAYGKGYAGGSIGTEGYTSEVSSSVTYKTTVYFYHT